MEWEMGSDDSLIENFAQIVVKAREHNHIKISQFEAEILPFSVMIPEITGEEEILEISCW